MKILAIEFSSPQRSVAVISATGSAEHSSRAMSEVVEIGGRPMNLLGMIEEALHQAQAERNRVEVVAVGLGPGSYTGIRAAIAIAQGWQLAGGVKLLGIGTAECIAAQALADGLRGRVEVVIDAQRGEFYLAGFELTGDALREVDPLRLASLADVQARAAVGGVIVGPEVTKWFPEGQLIFPQAATLGELSLRRTDFLPGEKLEPIYLRETTFVKAPPPRVLPD